MSDHVSTHVGCAALHAWALFNHETNGKGAVFQLAVLVGYLTMHRTKYFALECSQDKLSLRTIF